MLAGAMRSYANRWAVAADRRVAIFTNNDDGHRTAADLHARGVKIAAVVDTRPDVPMSMDYEVLAGAQVIDTSGRHGLAFSRAVPTGQRTALVRGQLRGHQLTRLTSAALCSILCGRPTAS